MAKKRVDCFINMTTELLEKLQDSNKDWARPYPSEANLAPEFASKLTSARSIPDAMTAVSGMGRSAIPR
jgi:hypothetical protein